MSDEKDKISFVGDPMTVSEFGKLLKRVNEIKVQEKNPHKVLGEEALRHKAEHIVTTQLNSIERAQATLAYLVSNDGKLTEEQSAKFLDYYEQIIEEERQRWFAATWYQRLWYRVKRVYWRVTFQSGYPFGVKVTKFKYKGKRFGGRIV